MTAEVVLADGTTEVIDFLPDPLLQPDPVTGCLQHSVAFVCRWFGHETPVEQVLTYRAAQGLHEEWYPCGTYGLRLTRSSTDPDGEARRYWLGPRALPWLVENLDRRRVAILDIERVPGRRHAVVLLEARPEGGLIMDPLSGYRVEPWDYLLADGPGRHAYPRVNHRVRGFYWRPADA